MTPTIPETCEVILGGVGLLLVVLLIIAWRVEADRRALAERRAAIRAEVARIAIERASILADRLRAAGIDNVTELDAAIATYAAARREAGI